MFQPVSGDPARVPVFSHHRHLPLGQGDCLHNPQHQSQDPH